MKVLAVVNDWRAVDNDNLRRCFPICDLYFQPSPQDQFPNNGQIFIVGGDGLVTGQLIWCEPRISDKYTPSSGPEESQYVCRFSDFQLAKDVAELVVLPDFNPQESTIRLVAGLVPARLLFVECGEFVFGPYQVDAGSGDRWTISPDDSKQVVDRIPTPVFKGGVTLVEWYHPSESGYPTRVIIPEPSQAGRVSEKVKVDCMPQENLPSWLATISGGLLEPSVLKALESASKVIPLSDALLRNRLERVRGLVQTAQTLEDFRRSVVSEFLRTSEGRELRDAHLARAEATYIQQRRGDWDQKLAVELADLQSQKTILETSLQDLQTAHTEERLHHERDMKDLEALEQLVRDSISVGTEELKNKIAELAPVWLVFSKQLGAGHAADAGSPRIDVSVAVDTPLTATSTTEYQHVSNERALVQYIQAELRRRGRTVDYHSVANLYVCLKSGYLTLLAGYPGVGKSSLARQFLELLGHGPTMLTVPVQRGWSDDRALLGYVNSLHGRYEPSTTGFLEHLLRATDDHVRHIGGLYTVLFDEMNLSPAEHYLARFISVMEAEASQRTISLYEDGCELTNGGRYPRSVAISDNVRFLGTLNFDYTTEALSPRLLDRANLIWMQPQRTTETDIPESPYTPIGPISFQQLRKDFIRVCSEDDLERARLDLSGVIGSLAERAEDLSHPIFMSARTIHSIATYVVNSEGLMERTHALDFQIQQRILPKLSGFGAKFGKRLERLAQALAPYERSTSRLREILEQGKDDGEYGFFKL